MVAHNIGGITQRFLGEPIMQLLGKRNRDGSFSISIKARDLVDSGWVDFYEEVSGQGYQRNETMRETRARDIEEYFKRCAEADLNPHIFELTGSARCKSADQRVRVNFDPLDENANLGFVDVDADHGPWMSMVDGGTRLRGIERAVASGAITGETFFDVRLFGGLSVPEEIALFLLINENQKRVRTDLSLRVVQRALDEGGLSDSQIRSLETVVPNTEQWRYEASRVAARLNGEADSAFRGLIQMPGQQAAGKSIKMQAFWTSLKHILDDKDLSSRVKNIEGAPVPTEFWVKVLKNFWNAVATVNPTSRDEPKTNVLWGSIGVNGCHRALANVVRSELSASQPNLSQSRFTGMMRGTWIEEYPIWYSRKGSRLDEYPGEKGEATQMTGNSGYIRLSETLETQWRANLHAANEKRGITL